MCGKITQLVSHRATAPQASSGSAPSPLQSALDVEAIAGVLTPVLHFVQLPLGAVPAFHSPAGQATT